MEEDKNINAYESKKFLLKFFKDCDIIEKNEVLTVKNVNAEFENFIGKKSPYKFVFDIEMHDKIPDSELIMQGSYFLLAIRDYLRDKGQTSLMKIKINLDLKTINKNPKIKKYKIKEIKQSNFNYIYKFSFLSNYQYLNNKKQSNNTLLIKDEKLIELDLNKFNIQKGNINEIQAIDTKSSYEIAKKILSKEIDKRTKSIKIILKDKLNKELHRIKTHYSKQIKEKDEELENCENKIKMLQSKLRHTSYDRDVRIIQRMIRESIQRLENLKKRSYHERLKAEEKFHINDEIEKHVLAINNILINLSVFYYDVYKLELPNGKFKIYDPILDEIK